MEDPSKRLLSHAYAITFDLGNGRSIQVNGSFYVDDGLKDMHGKLDGIMSVLERQRARAEVGLLEAELAARVKRLDEIDFQIAQVQAQIDAIEGKEQKRPGDGNQIAQLKSALETHKVNRKRMELEIPEGERALEEGRKRAA